MNKWVTQEVLINVPSYYLCVIITFFGHKHGASPMMGGSVNYTKS